MLGGMSLEEQFNAAKEKISATSQGPQQQLKLYGLFKQAMVGDNNGERPGVTKMRERAKFDAWYAHHGTSREDAMREYIDLVDSLSGV